MHEDGPAVPLDGEDGGTAGPAPAGGAAEPTPEELGEVALGVLARFQEAARARGDLRRAPRRRGTAPGPREADEGAPDGGDEPVDGGDGAGGVPAGTAAVSTSWHRSPGMAASRTRWAEPRALGAVIGRMSHRRGWDGPAAMGSVLARWPAIVGAQVAEHCVIETFEGHRLVVRCSSTAWTKQLRLLLPHIERRIEEEVGPGVVDQVVVRGPAAPSWKRGRLSVPGRGPRDTYG